MRRVIFLAIFSIFLSYSWAGDPIGACRVKSSTLLKLNNGNVRSNNAGCLIHKKEKGENYFLMVYVDKGADDKGWGFPGGGPSSKKEDSKVKEGRAKSPARLAISQSVDYDYVEPVACTASRETFEETGLEVVVGDLISSSKYFVAFECDVVVGDLDKLQAVDTKEVKKLQWKPFGDFLKKDFLRFDSNIEIAKEFLSR